MLNDSVFNTDSSLLWLNGPFRYKQSNNSQQKKLELQIFLSEVYYWLLNMLFKFIHFEAGCLYIVSTQQNKINQIV